MNELKTYVCKACHTQLPRTLEYFYSNGIGGMRNSCKKCKLTGKSYSNYRKIVDKPDFFECRTCKINKPFTAEHFYSDKRSKFNLQYQCIECKKEEGRERHFKKYNIDYNDLLDLKKLKNCFICNKESNLVVDHNHETQQVRGMLCQSCNKGLGHFFDSIETLEAAAKYLKKWDC